MAVFMNTIDCNAAFAPLIAKNDPVYSEELEFVFVASDIGESTCNE
jgi:hypothetical protein